MQPRTALLAFAFFTVWFFARYPKKSAALIVIVSMLIVSVGPGIMMVRNQRALGFVAISTNLGVTMNIGAGERATGGYGSENFGVPCPEAIGNPAQSDSARVRCVIKWYASNPLKTLKLIWNKSVYFWSPWFGPLSNGTMARNPWRINHPLNETIRSESGAKMVFGTSGTLISWLWIIAGLTFLFSGLRFLWRAGGLERLWALSSAVLIGFNWLISIGTIGDNRFRIPTMTLSVTLQTIGIFSLVISKRRRLLGNPLTISVQANSKKESG